MSTARHRAARLRRLPGRALRGAGGGLAAVLVSAVGALVLGGGGALLLASVGTARAWSDGTAGTVVVVPDPDGAATTAAGAPTGIETRLEAARRLLGPGARVADATGTEALLAPWLEQTTGGGNTADGAGARTLLPAVLRIAGAPPGGVDAALAAAVPGATSTTGGGNAGARLRRLGTTLVAVATAGVALAVGAVVAALALVLRRAATRRVGAALELLFALGVDERRLRRAIAARATGASTLGVLLGAVPLGALLDWLRPLGASAGLFTRAPLPLALFAPVLLFPLLAALIGFRLGRVPRSAVGVSA